MRLDVWRFYLAYAEEFDEEEVSEQERTRLKDASDDEFEQFRRPSATYRTNKNKLRKVVDKHERYLADDADENVLDPLAW